MIHAERSLKNGIDLSTSSPLRVLILTASMGEGHNTAAKNVREAILAATEGSAEVLVADPYTRTNPVINRLMQSGYTVAINNYPRAWKVVFELLSKKGVVEGMGPMLSELTSAVRGLICDFQPTIIASTYPVFSFLMAKIRKADTSVTMPFFTIITDSTQINSAWYRCPCDGSIVADEQTAGVLLRDGVTPDKVHVLGFPVSLRLEGVRAPDHAPGEPWRILLFPGGTAKRAQATVARLEEIPGVVIDVVTGRRESTRRVLQEAGLPRTGKLIGWTDDMPALMGSHHLFIGKAGGATVQEAIAARIPFVVSHVVPGQEEGNIALIQQSGIGALASASVGHLENVVRGALAGDGAVWSAWRANLDKLARPSASRAIADFLISRA